MMKNSNYYLDEAFKEALKAKLIDEVPIGAVIVLENKIIARAHNQKENKKNVLFHAEVLAVIKAQKKLKSWRLNDCILYTTLEPCAMCAAVLQQARIKKVYYGAKDKKAGAVCLELHLHDHEKLNHRFEMEYLEKIECGKLISDFFKIKRKTKK